MAELYLMETDNEFLTAYKQAFPGVRPTIYQMDLIEGMVTNLTAWRKTVEYWAGNDYRPQSVFKMIEYYKELDKKDHFQNVPEDTNTDYSCNICGKDICFDLHRAA